MTKLVGKKETDRKNIQVRSVGCINGLTVEQINGSPPNYSMTISMVREQVFGDGMIKVPREGERCH